MAFGLRNQELGFGAGSGPFRVSRPLGCLQEVIQRRRARRRVKKKFSFSNMDEPPIFLSDMGSLVFKLLASKCRNHAM